MYNADSLRCFRESAVAVGLVTQAQDVYLGHVSALLCMGFGFLTRSRDDTYLHFGVDPPFLV